MNGPFSLLEARAAGLTLSSLKSWCWARLGDELYCWRGAPVDPWLLLSAWRRVSPDITFSGRTAAWMHGLDFEPSDPVEAVAPPTAASRTRAGISIRRRQLDPADVISIRGLTATTVNRTLLDFCVAVEPVEALVAIDMAVRLGKASGLDLARYANEHHGAPGTVRLRKLATLAAPAESPMETRLRWLFVESGLPTPMVQVDLTDQTGCFIARADLYYPDLRLVIEFDGVNHRGRGVQDNRRQNDLINAGFTVLRFTTADLKDRPDNVVAQVRGLLSGASRSARVPSGVPLPGLARAPLTSEGRNGVVSGGRGGRT